MGQDITVTARPGSSPTVRMFSCNRSLTGMAIESYGSIDAAGGRRPPDVLAKRCFELGATKVTVYSSDVTVEAPESAWAALEPEVERTIEHLFGFYGEDAGWSDDRLRAMGIEPLPRPEPSA
jgi:phage baseplate assembly protein gpV